jgi:hypothetical protein
MSGRTTLLNGTAPLGTHVTDALSLGRIPSAAEYLAVQAKFTAAPLTTGGYTLNQDVSSASAVRVTISDTGPSITQGFVRVKGLQSPSGNSMYEDIDISAGAGEYETDMEFNEISDVFSWNLATLGGAGDESIRAEWMVSPYTGYIIANGLSANGVEDQVNVTITDDGASLSTGTVRIDGISNGVVTFENIDISAGAGVYPSVKTYTEITGVATVDVATIGGPVLATGGQLAYDNGTPPTAGKIVTIPDGLGNDYVYTFKVDVASTGNFSYTDATPPSADQTVTIPYVGGTRVYKFVPAVLATGGNLSYTDGTPPTADQTVTIPYDGGTRVYKFVAAVANDWEVKIEATADDSFTNLKDAINCTEAAGVGDNGVAGKYKVPSAHALFSAAITVLTDDVDLTTLATGQQGNVTLATTCTGATVTNPTGGNGVTNDWEVLIEATADDSYTNLTNAINMDDAVGVGDNQVNGKYKVPSIHTLFSAVITTATDDIDLTAKLTGERGNVTISTTCTGVTKTNPTGGAGVTNAGDVKVGTADATMLNLTRAINNSGGSPGVNGDYLAARSQAHTLVVAAHNAGGDLVTFTVQTIGVIGNINITTDEATITPTDPSGGTEDETILVEWDADGVDVVEVVWMSSEANKDLVEPANLVETAAAYNVFVQTTLDDGVTWCDIMNFLFTSFDLIKIHAVKLNTALAANVTPTDGGMSGNSILSGLIGNKIRLKTVTTDVYDGALIVVDVAVR